MRGVTPALSACRRPLHRRLLGEWQAYCVTAAIARNARARDRRRTPAPENPENINLRNRQSKGGPAISMPWFRHAAASASACSGSAGPTDASRDRPASRSASCTDRMASSCRLLFDLLQHHSDRSVERDQPPKEPILGAHIRDRRAKLRDPHQRIDRDGARYEDCDNLHELGYCLGRPGEAREVEERQSDRSERELHGKRVPEDGRHDQPQKAHRKHERNGERQDGRHGAEPRQAVEIRKRYQIERQDERLEREIREALSDYSGDGPGGWCARASCSQVAFRRRPEETDADEKR